LSLTQATDADDITVTTADQQGNSAPVAVTRVGTGHWTGRVTFSATGDIEIRASTTGSRMRTAMVIVTVAAGGVILGPALDEQVVDSDHDGLIDRLVLTPTITVPESGTYVASGRLFDESGVEVTMGGPGEISLVAGTQPVPLEFGGRYIYESGRWGPYTLKVTIEHEEAGHTTIELDGAVAGETATYDYMQFQHDRIAVDQKSLVSKAVDTNGDGLFEELDLSGTVTVENAGLYEITSGLYAQSPWGQVAAEYMEFQWSAGKNQFTVVYKGADIAKSGQDGPYQVPTLDIYLKADPMADRPIGFAAYKTAAYQASQFK
jgi:hypothetical protein